MLTYGRRKAEKYLNKNDMGAKIENHNPNSAKNSEKSIDVFIGILSSMSEKLEKFAFESVSCDVNRLPSEIISIGLSLIKKNNLTEIDRMSVLADIFARIDSNNYFQGVPKQLDVYLDTALKALMLQNSKKTEEILTHVGKLMEKFENKIFLDSEDLPDIADVDLIFEKSPSWLIEMKSAKSDAPIEVRLKLLRNSIIEEYISSCAGRVVNPREIVQKILDNIDIMKCDRNDDEFIFELARVGEKIGCCYILTASKHNYEVELRSAVKALDSIIDKLTDSKNQQMKTMALIECEEAGQFFNY